MNVLDLRGPQFLEFYLLLLGCMTAAAIFLRRLLRGPGPDERIRQITLAPLEIAYLSGGDRGAVDAAIAGLFRRGRLTADGATRQISSAGIDPQTATLLERTIWRFADVRSRRIDDLRSAARSAADPFSHRLREHELILSDGQKLLVRVLPPILLLAVLALGIAKVQVGLDRNKPVGFLILLCLVTGLIAIGFAGADTLRTRRGDDILEKFRAKNSALKTTGRADAGLLHEQDLTIAMALFGPSILTGSALRDLRTALEPPVRPAHGSGSSGCGGSSCGGGGCGGGGCGGGGCGGCGGG